MLVLAASCLTWGCDSAIDPSDLSGVWRGSYIEDDMTTDVRLDLQNSGREITGSGRYSNTNGTIAFTVFDGSFTPPRVVIGFSGANTGTFSFRGEVNERGDEMTGTFRSQPITLRR